MLRKPLLVIFSALSISPLYSQFSGNALDFDGVDDKVVVNTVPGFFSTLATSDFTFEAWVKPDTSEFERIFFAQPSETDFVSVATGDNNAIYFYVTVDGVQRSCETDASITQGEWTHVTARWTASTQTPEVFFDGVLQESGDGGISTTGTSGLMTLGSRPDGLQYFRGAMDEARLWNTVRTEDEIASNMNRSLSGSPVGLVCNWNFNEGIGRGNNPTVTTLPDLSGHGYTGTLNNFNLAGGTSNWIGSMAIVVAAGNPAVGPPTVRNVFVCRGASVTFPDGTTQTHITSTVTYLCSVPGSMGDSMITTVVNVTPVHTIRETVAVSSGGNYTFPDGVEANKITSTISHTSTFKTKLGCDSIIQTTVTVSAFDPQVISVDKTPAATMTEAKSQDGVKPVVVYPNPATDQLFINAGTSAGGTVEMVDVTGAVVLRVQFTGNLVEIDVHNLASGVYLVNIDTAEGRTVREIVKE